MAEAALELLFDAPVTGWAPGQVTLGMAWGWRQT